MDTLELPGRNEIARVFDMACSRGARFAELFFEDSIFSQVRCEDSRIEKPLTVYDIGVGLRIITDGRTVYGYTNDFSVESLMGLAERLISVEDEGRGDSSGNPRDREFDFAGAGASDYFGGIRRAVVRNALDPAIIDPEEKAARLLAADRAARAQSGEISQVQAYFSDSVRRIAVFNTDGLFAEDLRRQVVFSVVAVAADGREIQSAHRSIGGTEGFGEITEEKCVGIASEAVESAVRVLHAESSPAGRMTVVISSRAGGTMVHESIGHGLEGDEVERKLSIFSGRLGEMVASPIVTVVDDATIPGARGSFAVDDEGTKAQKTVLVENGVLKSFMTDRENARKLGLELTGNGRRESYRYRPIVRMSNTMIARGKDSPDDIVASVDRGLLVVKMGGGQVETSSGDFIFRVDEGYLIEKGKATRPVRGATLIGNGPRVLETIDMVGDDLGFDIGTCGKKGQHVPVSDAQPTIRISSITVGGEA